MEIVVRSRTACVSCVDRILRRGVVQWDNLRAIQVTAIRPILSESVGMLSATPRFGIIETMTERWRE